jgi:hypothetical protein
VAPENVAYTSESRPEDIASIGTSNGTSNAKGKATKKSLQWQRPFHVKAKGQICLMAKAVRRQRSGKGPPMAKAFDSKAKGPSRGKAINLRGKGKEPWKASATTFRRQSPFKGKGENPSKAKSEWHGSTPFHDPTY